jgi:CubicO group peptidase (beta-lactamase class C family)
VYSRRTLIRAAGSAVIGGLLAACSDDRAGTVTLDPATDRASATTTLAEPVVTSDQTSEPSTTSTLVASPSSPSTSEPPRSPSTSTNVVAEPWSGADFAELNGFLSDTNGQAFVIVERGVPVHEWYRTDDTFARDIASAQKSVLSLLVGRAIADGLFGVDTRIDDVLGTDWTPHSQTSDVTVRHLLTMTSGLDDRLALVAAPGTTWLYSGAFAQLFEVLRVTTGRDVDDLARDWLFGPAGAGGAVFYERRTDEFAPIGMRATAKDLVAIGQMVLARSEPGLPQQWLDDSFAPSQPYNVSYGYLWWLNGQESFMLPGPTPPTRPGSLIPTAPVDLVAALGKADQRLYVSRALDLVVARLGDKVDPESRPALSTFDAALWAMLGRLRSGAG